MRTVSSFDTMQHNASKLSLVAFKLRGRRPSPRFTFIFHAARLSVIAKAFEMSLFPKIKHPLMLLHPYTCTPPPVHTSWKSCACQSAFVLPPRVLLHRAAAAAARPRGCVMHTAGGNCCSLLVFETLKPTFDSSLRP